MFVPGWILGSVVYVIQRLREPSTAAGMAVIVHAVTHREWIAAVEGFLGLVAVLVPEGWHPEG